MNDPSSVTNLSTRTVILLMVFLPATILLSLIGVNYIYSPWT
jgi:hypothetical protein